MFNILCILILDLRIMYKDTMCTYTVGTYVYCTYVCTHAGENIDRFAHQCIFCMLQWLSKYFTLLIQGLLFSTAECLKAPLDFVRLWLHETSRVYGDKMIEERDTEMLMKIQLQTANENFEV